jgi:hypothetical protein
MQRLRVHKYLMAVSPHGKGVKMLTFGSRRRTFGGRRLQSSHETAMTGGNVSVQTKINAGLHSS